MLRIICRSAEEIQCKQNNFPFSTEYTIKINDNEALQRCTELCSFCDSFLPRISEQLCKEWSSSHQTQVLYMRTRKREAHSLSRSPFTLCGVWVYLNSMPIYIPPHMGAIYELGIYSADIL